MFYESELNKNEEKMEATVPCTIMHVKAIQEHETSKMMFVLLDPGSTKSYIKENKLPAGATPRVHRQAQEATTLSGAAVSNRSVLLQELCFPEFTKSLRVRSHEFWIHGNHNVRYDAIIGRDLLTELKIDICYSDGTMKMEGRVILMKKRGEQPTFYIQEDADELLAAEIHEAKYEKIEIDTVLEQQKHLNASQQQQLRTVLRGHEALFNGKLGKYKGKKIRLELRDDAQPVHCKPDHRLWREYSKTSAIDCVKLMC